MRNISFFVITLFILVQSPVFSQEFKAEQPVVVTAAGQSADALMGKILVQKAGIEFTFDKLIQPDSLEGHHALLVVSGGSTKGLGAAKINKDDEIARINKVIGQAKELKMAVIVMHLGGKARRGALSDVFNTLTANQGDCLVVVKSGNEDGFFSDIAVEKKIPLFLIERIQDGEGVLKQIFTESAG